MNGRWQGSGTGHVAARVSGCVLFAVGVMVMTSASGEDELLFDVVDRGELAAGAPRIEPWRTVNQEPDFGGLWVVAGDVDGDGAPEIVSAENFNEGDVHYTSAVAVQRLDGSVVWTWGDPAIGRKNWHHDVACQVHDWDNDGSLEVIVATKGFVVELDGKTGKEKTRFPIPDEATDCLVFCDLSGAGHAGDVLVKNRYRDIYAYNRAGEQLWHVTDPGGYRTAHQPRPMDVDGDGRDELMAGFCMLNPDGTVRWVFKSTKVERMGGHMDCARVVRAGGAPEDFRIAMTCCGGNTIVMLDGAGSVIWEVDGHHFESLQAADIIPGYPGKQILVDIDHRPYGEGPLWVLDENGKHLGRIMRNYSRHHRLLDWDGDGFAEIFAGNGQAVYNYKGERVATLAMPPEAGIKEKATFEVSLIPADMTGNGVQDMLVATPSVVCVFKNENGAKPKESAPLGSGVNFTLY